MQKRKNAAPAADPLMSLEKTMRDLHAVRANQEFESVKEANAWLQEVLGSGGPSPRPAASALDQAQDIMYEAWDATGRRRVALARQALALSPDCADAYVLLATEAAGDISTAIAIAREGVEAGKRALGKKVFQEDAGDFWGLVETRPYMRALQTLADLLWTNHKHDEAISHDRELLRLNPQDNQGIRYVLVQRLLAVDRDDECEALFAEYKDDPSATFAYSRALWFFRRKSPAAEEALDRAVKRNRFVPEYLLKKRKLQRRMPEYYSLGSREEAIISVAEALGTWEATDGAISWLQSRSMTKNRQG